jgi:ribosomal protein S18 acetylase RimI-like enzyme
MAFPLKDLNHVTLKIARLTRSIIDVELAARFKDIGHQLSNCSHRTPEQMKEFLVRAAQSKNTFVYGSFEDDLLVSTLSLYIDEHPWGIEIRVNNVVTDAPYRGRDHSERLWAHACAALPNICPIGRMAGGAYKFTLSSSNPIAIALYKKWGFKQEKGTELRLDITPEAFPDMFPAS